MNLTGPGWKSPPRQLGCEVARVSPPRDSSRWLQRRVAWRLFLSLADEESTTVAESSLGQPLERVAVYELGGATSPTGTNPSSTSASSVGRQASGPCASTSTLTRVYPQRWFLRSPLVPPARYSVTRAPAGLELSLRIELFSR
jgi:hypothetical protein